MLWEIEISGDTMSDIFVIDDDREMRAMVHDHLKALHFNVQSYESPIDGLSQILASPNQPLAVITDLQMPQLSGIDVVKRLKARFPDLPVIVMTAFGSVEGAVDAMRKGAFDYITKPFKLSDLTFTVERAAAMSRMALENKALRSEMKKISSHGAMLGKSKEMRNLYDLLTRVSRAQSSILITGESGTGKELVARTLHEQSGRPKDRFIAINCSAIPDSLLESELFGHAKGSFTGAEKRKKGLFEDADGGTLFLDEIGDMDLALQAKLLRVLQERKVRPVGENKDIDINVRVIAATHKDLRKAIQNDLFREDLYYRLNVIPIQIPPLRHRKEDIPLLAQAFLEKYAALNHSPARTFSAAALLLLVENPWQGNVRELENLVERLVVLARGPVITDTDIPSPESLDAEDFYGKITQDLPTLEKLEKRYIQFVLAKAGGKKDRAAHILGINRRTLYRKDLSDDHET